MKSNYFLKKKFNINVNNVLEDVGQHVGYTLPLQPFLGYPWILGISLMSGIVVFVMLLWK